MAVVGQSVGPITLLPMRQLADAQRPEDDWTGLTDVAERRKRQNRLHVRAHRRRKAAQQRESKGDTRPGDPGVQFDLSTLHSIMSRSGAGADPSASIFYIPPFYYHGELRFLGRALYPMSRDHLIPLITYNVFRACRTNCAIMNHLDLIDGQCEFTRPGPLFASPYPPGHIPKDLRPTSFQLNTPHPKFIDIWPSARMRENAIRNQHLISDHELCVDLLSALFGNDSDPGVGLIAWSDPWTMEGWEVQEQFFRKWSYLFTGCDDVLRATNRWRALRGAEPLVWEDA